MTINKIPHELKLNIYSYFVWKPINKEQLKNAVDEWCDNKKKAIKKYQHISLWDTHDITDMSYLFKDYYYFNDNISYWNVSNVTDMSNMFYDCKIFNKSLNNWNVSNVTDMGYMFAYCQKFNHPLNNWNVLNVINMKNMFDDCNKLNDLNVLNIQKYRDILEDDSLW